IQTTLLQRLDHTSNSVLRDRLVVIFATTNVSHLVDPAWLRRVGGETWTFGRLQRGAFASVMRRRLGDVPVVPDRESLVREVTTRLFAPNADDPPLAELDLAGTSAPLRRHGRDFLTGSVVDRALEQAAARACRAEAAGEGTGLTAPLVVEALDDQLRAVADGLTPANADNFTDVPEGARVVNVRRFPRPGLGPNGLERPYVTVRDPE
ncbi:MAG: hypothetical protein ACYS0D_15870, partial [Planctomycetota bacterium]